VELLNQAFAHALALNRIPDVQSSQKLLELKSLEILRPPKSQQLLVFLIFYRSPDDLLDFRFFQPELLDRGADGHWKLGLAGLPQPVAQKAFPLLALSNFTFS